jgi:hypothetical protein
LVRKSDWYLSELQRELEILTGVRVSISIQYGVEIPETSRRFLDTGTSISHLNTKRLPSMLGSDEREKERSSGWM